MSLRLGTAPLAFLSAGLMLVGCSSGGVSPIEPVASAIELGGSVSPMSPSPNNSASGAVSPSPSNSASGTSSPGPSAAATSSGSPASGEDSDGEDSDSTPSAAVFDKNAEIEIEDQSGNGKTVVISEFEAGIDNLWLVISTESGTIVGATLTTSQSKPVTVSLQRPITKSQELVARLYLDDGDGVLELSQDAPVYEEPGDLIDEDFEYDLT